MTDEELGMIIWLLNRLFWGPPRTLEQWRRLGLKLEHKRTLDQAVS